jgi:hypothetical protein
MKETFISFAKLHALPTVAFHSITPPQKKHICVRDKFFFK